MPKYALAALTLAVLLGAQALAGTFALVEPDECNADKIIPTGRSRLRNAQRTVSSCAGGARLPSPQEEGCHRSAVLSPRAYRKSQQQSR